MKWVIKKKISGEVCKNFLWVTVLWVFWIGVILIPGQTPNILFIFSDDHTYQSIGAYGGLLKDVVVTPNLDRIASEGMRFNRAYVTNSICGPSRAVIQTGKYSHKNGFYQNGDNFDDNQQTFPKLMRAAGYQTAIIGKWHLGNDDLQGFDYWDVLPGQGAYNNPRMRRGDINGFIEQRNIPGHNNDVVGDLALDWLQNTRDPNKPFILMHQFKATHRNWTPDASRQDMFDNVTIPEPPTLFDDYSYRGSAAFYQDMSIRHTMTQNDIKFNRADVAAEWATLGFNWDDKTDDDLVRWKYKRYLQDYLATAAGMDFNIGRVLDYLDSSGLAANTIVIYSSDQGFYLGEHGWFDKRFMYEESFRTPLLVRWPGEVQPGSVNDVDIVSNLDFAETFLDLAGLTIPTDMQGASIVPVLKGQTPLDWRKSFYYQYYEFPATWHNVYRHYGVTTGRYKLIYFHDVDEWEFYDLQKDPQEMINQYYIPENDSIINALKAELTKLRSDLEVPASSVITVPPTITPQQWTTPLPVKQKGQAKLNFDKLFKVTKQFIQIDVSGKYELYVYDVSGNLIQTVQGYNPIKLPLNKIEGEGVLIYKLRSESGIMSRRGIRI